MEAYKLTSGINLAKKKLGRGTQKTDVAEY